MEEIMKYGFIKALTAISMLAVSYRAQAAQPSPMICKSPINDPLSKTLFSINSFFEKHHQQLPAFKALSSSLENGDELVPCNVVLEGVESAKNYFKKPTVKMPEGYSTLLVQKLDDYQQQLKNDMILHQGVTDFQQDIDCMIQQMSGTRGSDDQGNVQLINSLLQASDYLDTVKAQTKVISLAGKRGGSSCCQCQRGPRGLPGDPGPQGLQGATGSSGLTGTTGFSGTTGESGLTGFSGTTGFSGSTGQSGLTGFSGTTGFSGSTGQSGLTGFSGTTGFSGSTGQSGLTGFSVQLVSQVSQEHLAQLAFQVQQVNRA